MLFGDSMKLRIIETTLYEAIADVKKYYPNIDDDTFMEIIALDPTYTGKDSVGKYGKWLLNLYNRGKISKNDFKEITPLLNQFTIYRNRIQNKDLNAYKTLDDLAEILASVVDDDSMLTPNQKNKFLKKVKSGKIQLDKSEDYDIVLDTPNFIVYVPNTHEASMKLGKDTDWCTAHENPDWYDSYTENGHKLYIVKNKRTGERWQYSDLNEDFLDQYDNSFDIPELMKQDPKLSKFFAYFLDVDYYNFDGTWIYDGKEIPSNVRRLITEIIISDNVKSIDKSAFCYCSSLISITIPNSVKGIGNNAFEGCRGLTSITIPDSITYIGNYAFHYCFSLTNILLPKGIVDIGFSTFSDCSNLISITIPNSVKSLGDYAFSGCKSLKSITIPNSVTNIGCGTFANCSDLTNITIPNSVTNIDESAFTNCDRLTSITIPNSVTSIGSGTFYNCSSLTSITIPNSVTSIGESAFCNCDSLTSIAIPNSVTSISDYAFEFCNFESIVIPNSVTTIGKHTFYGCTNLTSIIIPKSVTDIGYNAFKNCKHLTVYTDNEYVLNYCYTYEIPTKSLSIKNESYRSSNRLKLRIREI